MREGGVVACCLDCFLEGNNLHLFAYSVPEWFWTQSNIGVQDTCSMEPEEHPEKVLYVTNDLRPVRLAYKPYFFNQRTLFFSHNKSTNSTFSHGL